MSEQFLFSAKEDYKAFEEYIVENCNGTLFLVCGKSIEKLKINFLFIKLEQEGIRAVRFSDFHSNPQYESVEAGVRLFNLSGSNMIIAVGGGSAIDVAKCIKLFCNMDNSCNYLTQKITVNDVKLAAVPTTAGTGSEATKFAVIYYQNAKQSIHDESCIPSAVVFDPSALYSLPAYQKRATMLDAFSHAIESLWSVNSTKESRDYSQCAIKLIIENMEGYLAGDEIGCSNMLRAANIAGKAINITQTTAGHAMCYKLTSLYGIAHGHAAALVNSVLWPYMASHTEDFIDLRGEDYLKGVFETLSDIMDKECGHGGTDYLMKLIDKLDLSIITENTPDYQALVSSVNIDRLKNNPVKLDADVIERLYQRILTNKRENNEGRIIS